MAGEQTHSVSCGMSIWPARTAKDSSGLDS